jgi:ABC-type phosphate/phosphonate transport system permease subunit
MIGAGGIGQALYNAQLFFYDQMMAYVLITWATVERLDATAARMGDSRSIGMQRKPDTRQS